MTIQKSMVGLASACEMNKKITNRKKNNNAI